MVHSVLVYLLTDLLTASEACWQVIKRAIVCVWVDVTGATEQSVNVWLQRQS